LFGLFAFCVYQLSGFIGLNLVNIIILTVAFLMLQKLITSKSSTFISLVLALPAALFLATRTEIRPESLSLLCIIHTLWQLNITSKKRAINKLQIILLVLQQLLWVNWHITFVFGIGLTSLYLLINIFSKQQRLPKPTTKKLAVLTVSLICVSLCNPNHIWGLVQPLTIFADYGYSVVENQSLLFLWRVINKPIIWPYLFFSGLSLGLLIFYKNTISHYEQALLTLGIAFGGLALRNIPIFVVLVFPILARLIDICWQKVKNRITFEQPQQKKLLFLFLWFTLFSFLATSGQITSATINNRQLGLAPHQLEALNYIKQNNLKQPIFNNYDLGSYLIFGLYPQYQVFVDNRPEAYGKDFFQKQYIPMQKKPQIWQEQWQQYHFQTIIFGNNDITPWGRDFIRFINNQPEWQLAFSNQYVDIYQLTNDYRENW
jgi:hypothetical protein